MAAKTNTAEELSAVIQRKPIANGLAIIVANVKSYRDDHVDIPGAARDQEAMLNTFNQLQFATLRILNGSKRQITSAVVAAAKTRYPPHYKRIAFIFSGHGDGNFIYTYESEIHLQYEIFGPLMPRVSPHLARISKLFFIDACRGTGEDIGVFLPGEEPVARGGRAPRISNYLLAYSTLPSMKAYENTTGGYWSQEVARQLLVCDKSVADVLTQVNGKMLTDFDMKGLDCVQQPVLESTLPQPFSLLAEARELIKIRGDVTGLSTPALQNDDVKRILQEIAQAGSVPLHQHTQPMGSTNYASADVQAGGYATPAPVQWNPCQRQVPYQYSGASQVAGVPMSITHHPVSNFPRQHSTPQQLHYQPPAVQGGVAPTQVGYQPTMNVAMHFGTGDVNMSAYGAGHGASPVLQAGKGTAEPMQRSLSAPQHINVNEGYFKGQLNHYEQKGTIKCVEFSNEILGQTHKSEVTLTLHNGCVITGSSLHFHPTLSVAKEEAAKDAITKLEKQLNDAKYRPRQSASGVSLMASRGSQSEVVQKIWKSKLKEYFDKIGKPLDSLKIEYKTVEPPKGGFRSKVFVPGLGCTEGDVQRSKSEAEHDAARKALHKLEQ